MCMGQPGCSSAPANGPGWRGCSEVLLTAVHPVHAAFPTLSASPSWGRELPRPHGETLLSLCCDFAGNHISHSVVGVRRAVSSAVAFTLPCQKLTAFKARFSLHPPVPLSCGLPPAQRSHSAGLPSENVLWIAHVRIKHKHFANRSPRVRGTEPRAVGAEEDPRCCAGKAKPGWDAEKGQVQGLWLQGAPATFYVHPWL